MAENYISSIADRIINIKKHAYESINKIHFIHVSLFLYLHLPSVSTFRFNVKKKSHNKVRESIREKNCTPKKKENTNAPSLPYIKYKRDIKFAT